MQWGTHLEDKLSSPRVDGRPGTSDGMRGVFSISPCVKSSLDPLADLCFELRTLTTRPVRSRPRNQLHQTIDAMGAGVLGLGAEISSSARRLSLSKLN